MREEIWRFGFGNLNQTPMSTHLVLLVALQLMRLGHEEHPAHEVGGGDALRPLHLLVATRALDEVVRVLAVGGHGDVIAVHAEVGRVRVESLHGGDVGRTLDHLVKVAKDHEPLQEVFALFQN